MLGSQKNLRYSSWIRFITVSVVVSIWVRASLGAIALAFLASGLTFFFIPSIAFIYAKTNKTYYPLGLVIALLLAYFTFFEIYRTNLSISPRSFMRDVGIFQVVIAIAFMYPRKLMATYRRVTPLFNLHLIDSGTEENRTVRYFSLRNFVSAYAFSMLLFQLPATVMYLYGFIYTP